MARVVFPLLVISIASVFLGSPSAAVPIGPGGFAPGATVVDFENQSTTALPSIPNLQFVTEGGPTQSPWFQGDAPLNDSLFGSRLYGNLTSTTFSDLAVTFSTPVGAAGAWVGQVTNFLNVNASSLTISALGAGGELLGQVTVDLPAPKTGPLFVGFASNQGIARLEWRGGSTGFFGVDNITFGAAAAGVLVPEPSAALLILLGGSAMLLAKRGLPSR